MESTRNKKKSRIREKQEQSGKQGVADKSEGAGKNALNEREAKKRNETSEIARWRGETQLGTG